MTQLNLCLDTVTVTKLRPDVNPSGAIAFNRHFYLEIETGKHSPGAVLPSQPSSAY
ncbi:hypothetical protein [Oscillatoria acuminata]|uniref:hypothetical protein n=1 Tax=Oscillatoria acuminata TaxID=118323 RepID=UPI000319999D|nr:hypothetical protein [Oscillatoria acuminata]